MPRVDGVRMGPRCGLAARGKFDLRYPARHGNGAARESSRIGSMAGQF